MNKIGEQLLPGIPLGICAVRWRVFKLHPWPAVLILIFCISNYFLIKLPCDLITVHALALWVKMTSKERRLQDIRHLQHEPNWVCKGIKSYQTENTRNRNPQLLRDGVNDLPYLSQGYESFSSKVEYDMLCQITVSSHSYSAKVFPLRSPFKKKRNVAGKKWIICVTSEAHHTSQFVLVLHLAQMLKAWCVHEVSHTQSPIEADHCPL